MNSIDKLVIAATNVMSNSYSPYSKFRVGAAICTKKGNIFLGCNIENISYRATMCAETVAIGNMIANADDKILDIVIASSSGEICPPCGICRQVIQEFSCEDTKIYLSCKGSVKEIFTINELLPKPFCK